MQLKIAITALAVIIISSITFICYQLNSIYKIRAQREHKFIDSVTTAHHYTSLKIHPGEIKYTPYSNSSNEDYTDTIYIQVQQQSDTNNLQHTGSNIAAAYFNGFIQDDRHTILVRYRNNTDTLLSATYPTR